MVACGTLTTGSATAGWHALIYKAATPDSKGCENEPPVSRLVLPVDVGRWQCGKLFLLEDAVAVTVFEPPLLSKHLWHRGSPLN